jgi:hypothetical protein
MRAYFFGVESKMERSLRWTWSSLGQN